MATPFHDELVARLPEINGHADVLGMLIDGALLRRASAALAAPFRDAGVTKVAGVEARGFVSAAGAALELGAGFVAVRKAGRIHPGPKVRIATALSWRGREETLEVQRAALGPHDRVLVVDDWAETGSQALGAKKLIEACGAAYLGLSLLVDQLEDGVREQLAPVKAVANSAELHRGSGMIRE